MTRGVILIVCAFGHTRNYEMYGSGFDAVLLISIVLGWVVSLIIAFYIIRSAVRANEQIAILNSINEKQNAQIDLLISLVHSKSERGS